MNCKKKICQYTIYILFILLAGCSTSTNRSIPPTSTSIPTPSSLRFVNHLSPQVDTDFHSFDDSGCPADEYDFRKCKKGSPLFALGCDEIQEPSNLLGSLEPEYPIALCVTELQNLSGEIDKIDDVEHISMGDYAYNPGGGYFFRDGGLGPVLFRYVILKDNDFVLVETEDKFREIFGPVETQEEALGYVKAVTGLDDYYGLQPDPSLKYFVNDVVEDTYGKTVEDGYLVHLYYTDRYGCGPHPTFSVNFHITPQGHIQQLGTEKVFTNPSQDQMCVD